MTKPVIVLQATVYDDLASANLLNHADYDYVRQERLPSAYEDGIEGLAVAISETERRKREATLAAMKKIGT